MPSPLRRAGVVIAVISSVTGCSLDSAGTANELVEDTGGPVEIDSGAGDVIFPPEDTNAVDSTVQPEDTSIVDSADTTPPADTQDSAPLDTMDTAPIDTGTDTGVVDTMPETPVGSTIIGESGPVADGSDRRLNLTTEGSLDWGHWGHGGSASKWNRHAGGAILGSFAASAAASTYSMFPMRFSWTGGAPDASATDTDWGIYHDASGENFTFEAASTPSAERILRVYVTWNGATGTVEAKFSDNSATWSGPIPPPGGMTGGGVIRPGWYQFKYRSSSAAAKLQVKVTQTSGGYIGLLATTVK